MKILILKMIEWVMNFRFQGYRSVERDLETQIALVTKNEELQDSLQKEYERLFNCATPVTRRTFLQSERVPPAWVRVAVFLFRYYF